MKSRFQQRLPLIAGLTVGVSFILFSTIYLPYYGGLKSYRSDFEKAKLEEMQAAQPRGSASMWKNLDEKAKE